MLATFIFALWLAAPIQTSAPKSAAPQDSKPDQTSSQQKIDPEIAAKFLKVKRIYIDTFGEDKESQQLQAMVIDALVGTKRFIVTENKDKADATLKGTGLEKTSQEVHATGEATSVAAASGGASASLPTSMGVQDLRVAASLPGTWGPRIHRLLA